MDTSRIEVTLPAREELTADELSRILFERGYQNAYVIRRHEHYVIDLVVSDNCDGALDSLRSLIDELDLRIDNSPTGDSKTTPAD